MILKTPKVSKALIFYGFYGSTDFKDFKGSNDFKNSKEFKHSKVPVILKMLEIIESVRFQIF